MADNSYSLEIKPSASAGYFTQSQARSYYGKYDRSGVTYHWWNSPDRIADSDHDSIVNYMNGNAARGAAPTVNYVASSGKLTLLVNPDLVTWTSGNGNATTIGVECSPHFTDALYKKLGWLHDQLEQRYNRILAIYVHFEWMPGTQCSPIVKSRIRQEADQWKAERNAPAPQPAPTPVPATVNVTVEDIPNKKVRFIRKANMWDLGFRTYAEAKPINPTAFPDGFPAGHVIEDVSALATHPTGSKYYITEYSFQKGIKRGINVKDVEDYTDPITAPPKPTPIPPAKPPVVDAQPKPTEPVVIPVPITKDEEQDRRLSAIEAFINAIKSFFKGL